MKLARGANRGCAFRVVRSGLFPITLCVLSVLLPTLGAAQAPAEAQLKEAGELSKQGRHEESIELLKKIVASNPTIAPAWALLAEKYLQTNDFSAAEEAARRATALEPKNAEAWVALSRACERQEKISESALAVTEALKVRPDYLPALVLRAVTAIDPPDAIAAAQKAVKVAPKSADAYFALGRVKLRMKQSGEAVAAFKKAALIDPARADFQLYLAKASLAAKNTSTAVAAAQRATELAPEDLGAWRALGEAQSRTGQLTEAVASLQKAIELDPADGNIRIEIGRAFLQSAGSDWSSPAVQEAVGHFQKAVELVPELLPAWECLYMCQSKGQQRDGASLSARKITLLEGRLPDADAVKKPADLQPSTTFADFDDLHLRARTLHSQHKWTETAAVLIQIQRLRPNDMVLVVNIMDHLSRAGQKAMAIEIARGAVARFPKDAAAHFALGTALINDRQFKAAVVETARAVELEPKKAPFLFAHSGCLCELDRRPEAIKILTDALRLEPQNRLIWQALAICYNRDKNYTQGEAYLQKLLEEIPLASAGWYNLGRLRNEAGDRPGALSAFERAVEINPGDRESWMGIGKTYLALNEPAKACAPLTHAATGPQPDGDALNTLGWARGLLGDEVGAIKAYDYALVAEPLNSRALVNLMRALARHNQTKSIRPLWDRLKTVDPGLADSLKQELGL